MKREATEYRRERVNPPLCDVDGADVVPHPDGRAWRKSCEECAFRTCDPQNLGDGYQRALRRFDGQAAFTASIDTMTAAIESAQPTPQ